MKLCLVYEKRRRDRFRSSQEKFVAIRTNINMDGDIKIRGFAGLRRIMLASWYVVGTASHDGV